MTGRKVKNGRSAFARHMIWLHHGRSKAGSASKALWRPVVGAVVLTLSVSTAADAQINLAGASDADWTVLTIAPSGGWGTATEGSVNQAISGAIARCRSMSNRTLGCGAHQVSVQRGWALAVRCSEENILATGATRLEATESALRRELELRSLYHSKIQSCRQLVLVGPDGSVKVPQAQAVASDSSSDR
jgi:hypothetical protein